MHQYVKQEWVKALRSGEYEQGRDILRRPGNEKAMQFCCLGVLCDLDAKKRGVDFREVIRLSMTYLPDEMGRRFGLKPSVQRNLAEMNDMGQSFGPIADYIEKNL